MTNHRIAYSSLASKKMLKSDLYIILRKSRINNKLNRITGALVYIGDYFFQILEGERVVVDDLFSKISQDSRHKDVNILTRSDISEPAFSAWEMAYASPRPGELSVWLGLNDTSDISTIFNTIKHRKNDLQVVIDGVLRHESLE